MKQCYLLILSILFFVPNTTAQSIDDWFSIATIANVHRKEKEHLDKMFEKQAILAAPSTALSVASALTIRTEHRLHSGLEHVHNLIDNAQVIVLLINTSRDILGTQDFILDYVQDKPEIAPLAAYYEVVLLKQSARAMVNLILAIKESRFNLMTNSERLSILYHSLDVLKEISLKSHQLAGFLQTIHFSDMVRQGLNENILLNIDALLIEMNAETNTIIIG